MDLLAIIMIMVVYFDITESALGYCTFDQVKYGGTASCSSNADIDWSPAPPEKDFRYYAEMYGDILSVGTSLDPTGISSAFSNLYSNIIVKYGFAEDESDKFDGLIDQINTKINDEINRLRACVAADYWDKLGDEYNKEITQHMRDIKDIEDHHSSNKYNFEDEWDEVFDEIVTFGETHFESNDYSQMILSSDHGLKYEKWVEIFEQFNRNFGTEIKSYFSVKQQLCNDPDRLSWNAAHPAADCRDEYNGHLNEARELMENMYIWVMNSLLIIREEIYSYSILSKQVSGVTYNWDKYDWGPHTNHRINKLYFMQSYGYAIPDAIDDDSDWLNDVRLKMNDHGDKWCDLGDIWCDTYETSEFPSWNLHKYYYEHPTDGCKNALNNKAKQTQHALQKEINQYMSKLIERYLRPMEQRIDSFYTIPHLNRTTDGSYLIPRDVTLKEAADLLLTMFSPTFIRWKSDPTRCLDLSSGDNDNIITWPCHGGVNQQFRKGSADSDGYYNIISEYNNECLDANAEGNAVVDNSDNIITWPCHNGDNQKWKIDGNIIRCKANGGNTCIDAGDSNDNVHIWDCSTSNNNQLFEFPQWSTTVIRWKSDTTRCLDVNYGDNDNLFLGWCHGGANQRFTTGTIDSDGYYNIISEYNNECLDAHLEDNGVVDNSDNIYTHPCHNGDNQKWKFDGNIIRNKANGGSTCVDMGDSGNNVHIWDCCTSCAHQLFEFPY